MMRLSRENDPASADRIVQDVLAGQFRAVARIITQIENGVPEAASWLQKLFPYTGRCFTIGITGSPGSGKSTLVDCLAADYRRKGKKLGIIAVDPSSPFTGGAILGDRIRMRSRSTDPGTFIRSMATRGHLGGLSRATSDALLVLDAAGFDTVLIETVGVGQDEVEIVRIADITVVLLVPGMGDGVQALKAGIMEIGDVFVINKSDHPGAERLETEVNALLSMSSRPDGWTPRVVRTIASENQGIEKCAEAIAAAQDFMRGSKFQRTRTLEIQRERLLELVRAQVTHKILLNPAASGKLEELARRVTDREIDPYSAAEDLLRDSAVRESTRED